MQPIFSFFMRALRSSILSASLLLVSATSPKAHANLISNGGFETPIVYFYGYQTMSSLPGWVVSASGQVDVIGGGFWQPGEGNQSLDLVGNTGVGNYIEQSFATTIGQTYTLSFKYANNPTGTSSTANVLVTGASTLLNGNITHGGSTYGNMGWIDFSQGFLADSSITTLRFTHLSSVTDPLGSAVSLDAVQVIVPEPSVLALLALGAGAKMLRRKRTGRADGLVRAVG